MQIKKIDGVSPGQWKDIETKVYKEEGETSFKNIVKRDLIDKQWPDVDFEVRYFEISNYGYSSLEKHEHPHVVIIGRGKGKAIVGDEIFEAKPFDIFFIAPNQPHQFLQYGEEPFGFFCMVNIERDKPVLLGEEEKEKLKKKIEFKD
ncbi:cupin domain-containing protein [Candidatus Pacearchaeota archaeon]|nr:cupin domain-containing protein [Candidatus Pacearchaeota archaeon]